MWKYLLIIFFILSYISSCICPSVKPKGSKTRNSQPGCNVVLNEFAHRSQLGPFVEIAKLCEKGKKANKKIRLGGFYLLIIDSESGRLVYFENLHRRKLQLLPFTPADEGSPTKLRHSKHSKPKASRTKPAAPTGTTSEAAVPTIEPELLFDDVTEPCELLFDCADRKRRETAQNGANSTMTSRTKRSSEVTQKNVRGLHTIKLEIELSRENSYTVILLKVPNEQARALKGQSNFVQGQVLSNFARAEIRTFLHDFFIVNPSYFTIDHSEILSLLPDNQILRFLDFPTQALNFFSISKCDLEHIPKQHDGFTISAPTPQGRNDCKSFRPQPFGFKGSGLNAQSKKLVANSVIGLRDLRSNKDWLKKNEVAAAAAILNLHENTVYRITNEYDREEELQGPRKKSVKCPVTDLDTQKQTLLYKVITSYYKRNMVPYFAKIYEDFMREVNRINTPEDSGVSTQSLAPPTYQCSKWSFAKILKKNNYRYGKINERDAVIFKRNVLGQRKRYLETIRKYDSDSNWDVVYQDETWIDPYSRCGKGWVKKSYCDFTERRDFTFKDAKVSRGPRIIILAIGGKNGFVKGTTVAYLVSKAKSQVADYHGNINGKVFFNWMEKVLAALPRKTAIVIDNSPVHSVSTAPNSKTNKPDILAWMEEKKEVKSPGWELIPHDYATVNLVRLKEILKNIKDSYPQYRVDELIKEKGHVAIRLPPYQADLNPIEYVWSDVKRMARERNVNQNAPETLRIAKDILAKYTAEQWSRHIQHVKRVEDEYRLGDADFEKTMLENEMVEVNFADESDDSFLDEPDDYIDV